MTTTACKMTESEYRSHPALNASRFKAFVRSPYHFLKQVDVEQTEAMRIGTAIHMALLEPELYLKTIAYMPECDRRTTAGKQIAKEFEDANSDKLILKADSSEIVSRAVISVTGHEEWHYLLASKVNREMIILTDLFGIECKGKIDIIDLKNNMIWDVKTCQDASIDKFRYDVQDRLYWVQQAFYKMLVEKHYKQKFGCGFIAVETTEPSACGFYKVSEEELKVWSDIVENKLLQYQTCTTLNKFPSYQSGNLPALHLSSYKR
jgi:exodeoxyribonuclease VIII